MSEKSSIQPVCAECGSEPLSGALFCYHCGARLAASGKAEVKKGKKKSAKRSVDIVDKPIEPPPGDPFEDQPKAPNDERKRRSPRASAEARGSDNEVKSSPGIGKDPGLMKLRRIETRWTPEDDTPNIWFLIAASSLFLVAFGIFLVSMYLR